MWISKPGFKDKIRVTMMCFFGCMHALSSMAQVSPLTLQQQLENEVQRNPVNVTYPVKVKDFYKIFQYNPAWINRPDLQEQLLNELENADQAGLNKADYRYAILQSICTGEKKVITTIDSVRADLMFTDAAIHFFTELAFGNAPPDLGYNGLDYTPSCLNISLLLASALKSNQLSDLRRSTEPASPGYLALKVQYNRFRKMMQDSSFKGDSKITSKKPESTNRPLMEKLYELNLLDYPYREMPSKEISAKIKEAQLLFSFPPDGALTAALINELNVPLTNRITELKRAMNTAKWMQCLFVKTPHVILINIPSASLFLFESDRSILYSKVIVGKPSTRTPLFASKVTEVVMYPYWMVPKKIATKELLPQIKKNISYLNANAFQVVNSQGSVVNPYSINWHALNAGNFPYILRQSTGCDNSLGLVKLNFYSPYGVYLHDTPAKKLFGSNRRFFSHGCIRVEKALTVARLLMNNNTITIDTLEQKGCLRNQKPVPIGVSEKMPVFVLYNTAWTDSSGIVRFYPDVYNRFS